IEACSATATTSTVFVTPTPIEACYFGGAVSQSLSSPTVGPTSCPLSKRTVLTPENFPNNNVDGFLLSEMDNAAENGNLLEARSNGIPIMGGLSSSKRLPFLDRPFRAGVNGQSGCTSVFIFSKQGMWEAHFWEIPAFAHPSLIEDGVVKETIPSPDEDF